MRLEARNSKPASREGEFPCIEHWVQLQVGDYPPPPSTPRPESEWEPETFPNNLKGLWQSYIAAKDKMIEVLNAIGDQGQTVDAIRLLKE